MDPTNFVIKTFTNIGKGVLSDVKAYANSASDEIDRLRGQLEYERARTVAELEAANRRALAAEDRFAALEATGLMQQVVDPELEDVIATSTAEVEAEMTRAVAEAQAESVNRSLWQLL
jgi:hypothetical protein